MSSPDYRSVWRWHFYAGLIAIPFVLILSLSGTLYLFKPQIESYLERPYNNLPLTSPPKPPAQIAQAALSAFPGSSLRSYELPPTPTSAPRVLINHQNRTLRVYVHPTSLAILASVPERQRLMRTVFRIHGELLIGTPGSYIVEIAASWTIVLILTGLYLWWPRNHRGLAGLLYPRLTQGSRVALRDIHAVTGLYISFLALLLLLTGLPWAKFWGDYLKTLRHITSTTITRTTLTPTNAPTSNTPPAPIDEHAAHTPRHQTSSRPINLEPLNTIAATVEPLRLADPVLISPPDASRGSPTAWTAKSDAANRTLRAELTLSPQGQILSRVNFSDRPRLDRLIATGVAAHEGQLFGPLNQLLGLLTALGLVTLSLSAIAMWWKRRPAHTLGAPTPPPAAARTKTWPLVVAITLLALYLPLFALTLLAVRCLEHVLLRRLPPLSTWLGLQTTPTKLST